MFYTIDEDDKLLSIAIHVQTTGWVGLGLSPTGQMPGSDVVIGWVDNSGASFFQVFFTMIKSRYKCHSIATK